MGCISSTLLHEDIETNIICGNVEYRHHVVSLTSTTYGLLNLDKNNLQDDEQHVSKEISVVESKKSPPLEDPEVINAWELMEGLEEDANVVTQTKRSPKGRLFLHGFGDFDPKTPLRLLAQMGSPRKAKKSSGKENKGRGDLVVICPGRAEFSQNNVLRARNSVDSPLRTSNKLRVRKKLSPNEATFESLRVDSRMICSRRRSLSLMFDPELVDSCEKGEQIKKIVTPRGRNSEDVESVLQLFEKICPPGGENSVIFYSTTLRGIRKTFEDCNTARSIIESHHVRMIERDISMHSGFKEELRRLMGTKNVKVPLIFVKGRLIGGADEVGKLEEEGKLEILFNGIPKAVEACEACAGIRFIMCMDCNGSSKVLGSDGKRSIKCGECNENGLIQCPVCC